MLTHNAHGNTFYTIVTVSPITSGKCRTDFIPCDPDESSRGIITPKILAMISTVGKQVYSMSAVMGFPEPVTECHAGPGKGS